MSALHPREFARSPALNSQGGEVRPRRASVRSPNWWVLWLSTLVCVLLVAPRQAGATIWDLRHSVPVARLMRATEVAMDRVGRQPHLLYRLARLHYVASILGEADEVARDTTDQDWTVYPAVDSGGQVTVDPNAHPKDAFHIRASLALFREAIAIQPDHGLALLGLATLIEQAAESQPAGLGALPGDPTPSAAVPIAVQQQRWLRQAATYYGQAASAFARQGRAALIWQVPVNIEDQVPLDQGKRFLEAADAWHRLARRFRLVDRPTWAAMERRVRRAARYEAAYQIDR